jgi:hypothetical protein
MKHSLRVSAILLLLAGTASAQSVMAPVGASPPPWVANRAVGRGAGIRVGDFELHPGISGEAGYDSNWYQRAGSAIEGATVGPVSDALRFRVTPSLSLSTLDQRAAQASGETPPPRAVQFRLDSYFTYNELVGLNNGGARGVGNQRNFQGALGADLELFRGRPWSGSLEGGYGYIFEPANIAGFIGANDRNVIHAGAGVRFAPGGGAFSWDILKYRLAATLFGTEGFRVNDNLDHTFSTEGHWRFLPKTALVYDGSVGLIRYSNVGYNSGVDTSARVGLNGLILTRLGVLIMGGWAVGFRDNSNGLPRSYDDVVAKAELKYYFGAGDKIQAGSANTGLSSVALGYDRSFENSYLGDFFQRDRGYARLMVSAAGRWILSVDGGVSGINYPDLLFSGNRIASFSEVRLDAQGFVEYRPTTTIGINATIRYNQNISRVLNGDGFDDDLSFSRVVAFVGARWFL